MPFKVANVICRFNSGAGGPPRTVALIGQLSVGHWKVELFTTDYLDGAADVLLTSEFPGHVNVQSAGAQRFFGGLLMAMGGWPGYEVQLVRGTAPNIVHIHGLWTPYLTAFAWAARRHGIPYVVAPHGMLEPWSLSVRAARKSLALKTYQGNVLAGASAIHATSDAEADHLRRLPCIRSPIFVVPNAVEEPRWAADAATPATGATRVLLFLSRLHEKKGLDILLRAWNELRPSQWKLLIVGSGDAAYVQRLQQFCATKGVPSVEFHSHVDGDAREAMFARATAFVLPTFSENFGNAVAEALVRGLPVITTTGTPWSVIAEERLGWYIDPDIHQLQEALRQLFATDMPDLKQMGARARAYAAAHLSTTLVRKRLFDMYERVLQSP